MLLVVRRFWSLRLSRRLSLLLLLIAVMISLMLLRMSLRLSVVRSTRSVWLRKLGVVILDLLLRLKLSVVVWMRWRFMVGLR